MNYNITYYFKILLSVVLFSTVGFTLCAQQRTNPFEIKPRLSQVKIQPEPTQNYNTTVGDSIATNTLENEPVQSLISNENVLLNPFDVDHVPIRKSAITQRAEKLHIQANKTEHSNSFLIWFLLFTCVIIAIVINLKSKIIGYIYRSIFNENILKLFQREEQRGISIYLLLLYLSFLINISILTYLINNAFGGQRGIIIYMIILGIFTAIYMIKHIAIYLLGKIFMVSKSTDLYGFTIMVFNQALGIFLIPLNFIIAFSSPEISNISIWFVIGLIIILLILRTLRGLIIVYEYFHDSLFQIIVYLCAFEIAPVLILVKMAMNYS